MTTNHAILLDRFGDVSEAPGENIFVVKNNNLITPPLSSSALDGITRNSIISFSKEIKLKAKIRKISKAELLNADEIFLSGTAAEVTPVTKIEREKIGSGEPGPITIKIMNSYSNIVMNKNKKYAKWLTAVY